VAAVVVGTNVTADTEDAEATPSMPTTEATEDSSDMLINVAKYLFTFPNLLFVRWARVVLVFCI
jgi:hypothetical protein